MGCGPCRGNSAVQADGSVLDRVISQASNEDQCLLYKLANYKKGGELIDAYNLGGQAEVEKLIREQFGMLMYNEGKGQIINRAEYLRWKFRDHKQVVLPIEASLSRHDPLSRWHDHPACWQMRHRGALGESLLHVLIICDTRVHTRLARTLLKCFPKLALDVVEGEEYLGASALHLAIAYFNNELVQDLVEAGANVNQKAIGSFFLPRDQQRPRPTRTTDYEGLAYLGEFPLAWAACCANESVYNLLLDSGADPDLQDSFGNMILHMVVVCDKLDMFGYALRHPKLPASNGKSNTQGLTPLTLACKLGRAEVFKEMLELSAKEFWRYSNITCSAYPLNALDTLLPDGRTNWNSALFIILNGTKEEHLDMLDGGIIQRLLEEKWKTFARNQFLKRLLILFIHLVSLSLAVYLRPSERSTPLLGAPDSAKDALRYACELGTLIGVLSYVLLQQGDEVKNQGLGAFLKQLTHAPAKAIFLVSNLLILACIPYRLIGDKETEEAILVFAVPGSWFLLMFFAGAVRLTGPFVTMIYSMITGDMLTFGIIYMIVLFGFSQSFYFLYKGFPGVKNSLFGSYPSTWMALFQITLGDYSYSDLGSTTYPNLSKSVFAIFMVFVPILLLNMLIAMMGNTYAHVIEQSEKEWMKQWAKIVVTLERAVPQGDCHHYLQEYSIGLGPSDDPRYEQRGVMVIKSKAKTRAKQRKGAVTNWKRVGKVTINELRKRGMTGEDLRRIMWGRASISTPTKIPIKPLLDPSVQQTGLNIAGGFGEAMSSALDVMAFTHNLDMTGANGINLHSNATRGAAPTSHMVNGMQVSGTGAGNGMGNELKVPGAGMPMNTANSALNFQPQAINTGVTIPISSQMVMNQSQATLPTQSQISSGMVMQGSTAMTGQIIQATNTNIMTGQPTAAANNMVTGKPISQMTTGNMNINNMMMAGQPTQGMTGNNMMMAGQPMQGMAGNNMMTGQPMMTANNMTGQPIMQGMVGNNMMTGQPLMQGTAANHVVNNMMMTGQTMMQATAGTNIINNMMMAGQPMANLSMLTGQPMMQMAGQQVAMKIYSDPLREIIHLSDSKDSSEFEDKIKSLAAEAANLYHVEEVIPLTRPLVKLAAPQVSVAGALTNLFGVEAGTGPTVDWHAGDKRQKKLSAMEPNDSDGLGEAPLLGRSARTRRARSATKRNIGSGKTRPTTAVTRSGRLLLAQDSSSGDGGPQDKGGLQDSQQGLEVLQTEGNIYRIPNVSHESEVAEIRKTLALKDVRPSNIEQAAGSHAVMPGLPAVGPGHRTMDTIAEKAVIFKGEGSGIEVESGNNEHAEHFREEKTYSKDKRKIEKRKTRTRPKTARHNRVAPMVYVNEETIATKSAMKKRGKSAHHTKRLDWKRPDTEEPQSPPDPLENWSTAGLASMNSLLSWENESDGY